MRRLRKYIAILLVFAGLYSICWLLDSREEMQGPQRGTAATVAELRKQIPLHYSFYDIPEIGPFHWEGPFRSHNPGSAITNDYRIWGKAEDPKLLLKWLNIEHVEGSLDPQEHRTIAGFSGGGIKIEVFSDGSYELEQHLFADKGPRYMFK